MAMQDHCYDRAHVVKRVTDTRQYVLQGKDLRVARNGKIKADAQKGREAIQAVLRHGNILNPEL